MKAQAEFLRVRQVAALFVVEFKNGLHDWRIIDECWSWEEARQRAAMIAIWGGNTSREVVS